MKSGVRILGAQLAELIVGQTLTVPEMHVIVGMKYPGYEPSSLWVALKTIKDSVNCNLELTMKNRHRAYRLKSVSPKFYGHSQRIQGRNEKKGKPCRSYFTSEEFKSLELVNEFNELISSARASTTSKY
jgi:hypothetical protein